MKLRSEATAVCVCVNVRAGVRACELVEVKQPHIPEPGKLQETWICEVPLAPRGCSFYGIAGRLERVPARQDESGSGAACKGPLTWLVTGWY